MDAIECLMTISVDNYNSDKIWDRGYGGLVLTVNY